MVRLQDRLRTRARALFARSAARGREYSPSARARQRAVDGLVHWAECSSLSGRVARSPLRPKPRDRDGPRAGRIGAFVAAALTLGEAKNARFRRPPGGARDLQAAAAPSRDASVGKPSAPIEKA